MELKMKSSNESFGLIQEENILKKENKIELIPDATQLNWAVPSVCKKILTHNYLNKSIHLEAWRAFNQSMHLLRAS